MIGRLWRERVGRSALLFALWGWRRTSAERDLLKYEMRQQNFRQYRAAACVQGSLPDHGVITQVRSIAERELADMLAHGHPLFDEGWVETRLVTAWRRT